MIGSGAYERSRLSRSLTCMLPVAEALPTITKSTSRPRLSREM